MYLQEFESHALQSGANVAATGLLKTQYHNVRRHMRQCSQKLVLSPSVLTKVTICEIRFHTKMSANNMMGELLGRACAQDDDDEIRLPLGLSNSRIALSAKMKEDVQRLQDYPPGRTTKATS